MGILSSINVRELRTVDILALNTMYHSSSKESKRLFHPGFLGFETIGPNWLLAQLALACSSLAILRTLLLRVYPQGVFFAVVSVNEDGEIVGFAFIRVRGHISKSAFFGELGICVRGKYQGKDIGSKLMQRLVDLARNQQIKRIYLTVLKDNIKAIHLYQKYGFRENKTVPEGEVWHQQRFDLVEMRLEL